MHQLLREFAAERGGLGELGFLLGSERNLHSQRLGFGWEFVNAGQKMSEARRTRAIQ
jgi:hypothetical protein